MAGFTDGPARRIARRFGADITYTEMISARALLEGHRRTRAMLDGIDRETSVVVQFMGSDPDIMAEAAAMAEGLGADGIDINLGCSVRKIVRNGAGAALMREPTRVAGIVSRVSSAIRIPLSVKIRAGWDERNMNAVQIGRIAQDSGAEAVAIHGRLASQGYTGEADWNIIRVLVRVLGIPVVGNGDVRCWEDAEKMVRRIEGAKGHLLAAYAEKGRRGLLQMRKQLAWYLRGFPGAREVRDRIHRVESVDSVVAELEGLSARIVDQNSGHFDPVGAVFQVSTPEIAGNQGD
jgi:nifR3 family TIM-barrel protein